ncbi:MAG TPA: hypothetical protein VIM70_11445 [Clostridium sp.]|uniref:hypothetical protein n=1 Tax=Clostridium sp. TaxID=1506 RepID=UPI002F93EA24
MAKEIKRVCPNCGSSKTNEVSWSNSYCLECDIEFNMKSNECFTILYDGELVPYHVNEFENCG